MKCSLGVSHTIDMKHNTRDFDRDEWNKNGHIDYSRTHLNETLINMPLEKLIDQECGDALVAFNEKNKDKHPDRLFGYKSKKEYDEATPEERRKAAVKEYTRTNKKVSYEAIIQLGDGEHWQMLNQLHGQEKARQIHMEFLRSQLVAWQKQNPTLKVFGAYIHMDETTPHLHLDFMPIATKSKGLTKYVSVEGAIKQINPDFDRSKADKYADRPFIRWLDFQRDSIETAAEHAFDKLPFWQRNKTKELFKIEKSEPYTKERKEAREWRAEQELDAIDERKKQEVDLAAKELAAIIEKKTEAAVIKRGHGKNKNTVVMDADMVDAIKRIGSDAARCLSDAYAIKQQYGIRSQRQEEQMQRTSKIYNAVCHMYEGTEQALKKAAKEEAERIIAPLRERYKPVRSDENSRREYMESVGMEGDYQRFLVRLNEENLAELSARLEDSIYEGLNEQYHGHGEHEGR